MKKAQVFKYKVYSLKSNYLICESSITEFLKGVAVKKVKLLYRFYKEPVKIVFAKTEPKPKPKQLTLFNEG